MPESLQELLARGTRDGWTEGLVYHVVRLLHADDPEKLRVCVRCGWFWVGVSNRCMNPECRGFCTWGERKGAEPDSWVKVPDGRWRPRLPGEAKN